MPRLRRTATAALAALTLASLLSLGLIAVTAAADETDTLDLGASVAGWSIGFGWNADSGCPIGGLNLAPGFDQDFRCALEFDISGLPAEATITSATLSLRIGTASGVCSGTGACLVDIAGYVGDGIGDLADLTAGSTLLTFVNTTSLRVDHDVTAFVTGLHGAGDDWAGFRLSRNAGSPPEDLEFLDLVGVPPLLIVEYSIPDPATPTPSQAVSTPAPTANPSAAVLPDTAATSGDLSVAAAVLGSTTLASCAMLLLAWSRRTRVSRR